MQVFQRYESCISYAFAVAIGAASATQISGASAPATYTGLYGLSVAPNVNRQGIIIHNPSAGILYIGIDNTVTSAGAHAIETIGPGQTKALPFNGTFVLWAIGSISGTTADIYEVM